MDEMSITVMNPWPAQGSAPGGAPRARVLCYAVDGCISPPGHEDVTRARLAAQLATLMDYEMGGEYQAPHGSACEAPQEAAAGRVYYVPSRTLVGTETARALGIAGEEDLFGGVVPHAYVGTKSITHPLAAPDACAPAGWCGDFCSAVAQATLPGYSAYDRASARRAAMRLLELGPVRVKRARETGGRGQLVVRDRAGLDAALAAIDAEEIARDGVVLEQNLEAVQTCSVGQVRVGALRATYFGVQMLTRDNNGAEVYGGSDLTVVRGDYAELLSLGLQPGVRLAIEQACCYDGAASRCFPGFIASRRNYDIAQGLDARGRRRSGVLEQSWRIGGASGAEVAALLAFAADPQLRRVRATSTELYGPGAQAPAGATVHYQGEDPRVGHITKYTELRTR